MCNGAPGPRPSAALYRGIFVTQQMEKSRCPRGCFFRENTVQQKWKEYWAEIGGHALKTFVYYPPLMILFHSAASYFGKDADGSFWPHVGYCENLAAR